MAVKLTGSLSLTEIDTEWTLGFDLDSYRGTQWFLTPSYSGPRSPRGKFGPDLGSGYTAVSYSDFYGTGRFAPTSTEKLWLVGGGGGGGAGGGGGGGGGVRPTNVSITGGGTYVVTVGTGGVGGTRTPTGTETTNGNASSFHNVSVGGGGFGSARKHGGDWPYATFQNSQTGHPQGGGGGGASHTNNWGVGGKGGGYGTGGGNNVGFGSPQAHPYAGGGGGGGGYQATRGWNGYGGHPAGNGTGVKYNANVDRFPSPGFSYFTGNGYYPHTQPAGGPVNSNPTGDYTYKGGPGGAGTYTWPGVGSMSRHGGGGGAGWTKWSVGSVSNPIPGWGGNLPGSGGGGGGAPGAPEPSQLGTYVNGPNGGAGYGGGGGGGGHDNFGPVSTVCRGGNGGSGAVYLAYAAPVIGIGYPASGHSTYVMGNYQIHKWTQSGTYYHAGGTD